ncbi:MAG: hypothetical protein PHC39_08935 [Proteiniphilum sp.]|nr:hypothetical protein [Proteiniphilum sp.]
MSDNNTFLWIALFAILAAIINGLGIFILYRYRDWAIKSKPYFICFVAGVLIYVSASHLLPEARGEEKKHSSVAFLGGVALALFIVFSKMFG